MSYNQLFSLHGKNIVITGGLGLLGREFAKGICAQDGSVTVIDQLTPANEENAASLRQELGAGRFAVYYADLADLRGIQGLIGKVESERQGIHGLINNAAIKTPHFFEHFLRFPVEDWEAVMRVNCDAAFFVAQSVANSMIERKLPGSIINILSIYGLVGPHESIYEGSEHLGRPINTPPIYSASKGALDGLTRYLAVCMAKYDIRVNAITPGGVSNGHNSTFSEKYSEQCPMKRQARASEMVGAAIYLLSEASSYVTGHNLVVDGGWTAW